MASRGDTGLANIVSDDFQDAAIGAWWTQWDPVGDGTYAIEGAGTTDARLRLSYPDVKRSYTTTYQGLTLLQSTNDDAFQVEASFSEAAVVEFGQVFGIFACNAARTTRVAYYLWTNSTSYALQAGEISSSTTWWQNASEVIAFPVGLRLQYDGVNTWSFEVNQNGGAWSSPNGAQVSAVPGGVAEVGVFIANGSEGQPHSRTVDWLWETTAPISPEDQIATAAPRRFMVRT